MTVQFGLASATRTHRRFLDILNERRDAPKTPSRISVGHVCLRMQELIPLYSADGELQDWISEQRMARLDRLGLIRIVRHKKGLVSRCILHRRPGDSRPMKLPAYLGTRYSYLQHLDCGRWVWTLRKLRTREESHAVRQAHVAHIGLER